MDSDDDVMTLKYSSYHHHSLLLLLDALECKRVPGLEESKFGFRARILQNLYGGPNVVKLLDVVRDPQSKTPSLVGALSLQHKRIQTHSVSFSTFLTC